MKNDKTTAREAISIQKALSPKSISFPDVKFHTITDDELSILVEARKPYQASAAFVSLGIAIPALPQAFSEVAALSKDEPTTSGVLWLIIFVGAVIAAVIFGVNGIKGKSDAKKLMAAIRARTQVPLPSNE